MTDSDEIHDGPTGQMLQDWATVLPDIETTSFSVQLRIAEIDSLAIRTTNKIAAGYSINHVDVRLLMAIKRAEQETPIRPSDLWRRFDIAPSAITRRVDRLFDLGLVERTPHPTDRRGFYVKLTNKGQKTTAEIVSAFHAATLQNMSEVDSLPGGRQMLDKLLGALLRGWAGADETPATAPEA